MAFCSVSAKQHLLSVLLHLQKGKQIFLHMFVKVSASLNVALEKTIRIIFNYIANRNTGLFCLQAPFGASCIVFVGFHGEMEFLCSN